MILIMHTAPSMEEAKIIARTLLEKKWAACINIIPGVESFFIWMGKIEEVQEVTMLIKTDESFFPLVESLIKEYSSYDVPEVTMIRIDRASADYIAFLQGIGKN